jgi:hydrogenase maturation protein HypF
MSTRTVRIRLSGAVQGCGVRPALTRLANANGWSGKVKNTCNGADLILAGNLPEDDRLLSIVRLSLPLESKPGKITIETIEEFIGSGFSIEASYAGGTVSADIPCDVAICPECLADTQDPTNRRFRYPLTSCSRCGPRFSVLMKMPFDRERTTLNEFPLCGDCDREYHSPNDRRFHAQTIGCATCGPKVWLSSHANSHLVTNDDAIRRSAEAILRGDIVAVRGIGGYQLLVDATSAQSVRELRKRKCRPDKPFAVLFRTLADVRKTCIVDDLEAETLLSRQNPIVLLRQCSASLLAVEVNPRLAEIGTLLPTTAVHDRLLELTQRPLVCTSGNLHNEPIVHDVDHAMERLAGIADLFLHHNREIVHPVDDSVVKVVGKRVAVLRCARGYAPMRLEMTLPIPALAAGGEQKSAIAVSNGIQAWLWPHIGDLNTVVSQEAWSKSVRKCTRLLGMTLDEVGSQTQEDLHSGDSGSVIRLIASDHHPDYFSTRVSARFTARQRKVWHHHAHALGAMTEYNLLGQSVLAVAFDGTGLGSDGTIWGGEFLISSVDGFRRIGHLRQFGLPGGEAAIRDVRRLAVSLLTQLDSYSTNEIARFVRMSLKEVVTLQKVLGLLQTVRTSSAGRLFDAVSCMALHLDHPTYDGQPAMVLEAACDLSELEAYPFELKTGECFEIDWRPMLRNLIEDLRNGVSAASIATRFHRGVGCAILSACEFVPDLPVLLCGGVFQNRVLVNLITDAWPSPVRKLGIPGRIPVNDGGLAVGQLASLLDSGIKRRD